VSCVVFSKYTGLWGFVVQCMFASDGYLFFIKVYLEKCACAYLNGR
jgi:hypothetical protein